MSIHMDMQEQSIMSLKEYMAQMFSQYPAIENTWYTMDRQEQALLAYQKVEEVLVAVREGETSLLYPSLNDWSNVQYHPAYGLLPVENPRMSKITGPKLDNVVMVLEIMLGLIESGTRTTKRDIFYQHFCDFSNQRELDSLVGVIVAMMQIPRLLLGVVATSKGLVVGDLLYTNSEDVVVDCSLAVGGDSVPQDVMEMRDVVTTAKFVLVVEKDAVFQRLLEEGVMGGHMPSMIMITGKGVPDLASRQLVYMLSSHLGIPVMIMTDCDPYGLDICMMYKYGSLAMSWAAESLAVPTSVWLGLLPSDISRLSIMPSSMKPHSAQDCKKMVDLSRREYVMEDPLLRGELEVLWEMGRKAEIQQVAEERERGFLAQQFLPRKIAECGWV
eukprot:GFUD01020073.1.p1 GENE.GFUD01020073.1~~GFUD01020073.1.p1  ORF type:complete len:386 (-),score=150.16 GFUD01020073.1:180-1337(-)